MGEHIALTIQHALEAPPCSATITSAHTGTDALRLTAHRDGSHIADMAAAVARWPEVTITPTSEPGTYDVHIAHDSSAERTATPVRVPPELAAAVKARRQETSLSAADQVLEALAEHNVTLRERNTARRARLGLAAGAPQRRRGIGPTVQLWLNTTAYEDAALTAAADDWCSGNKSHLVTELLRATHHSVTTRTTPLHRS